MNEFNPNCGRCGMLNSRGYCSLTACRFPVNMTIVVKPTAIRNMMVKPQKDCPKPCTNYDRIVSKPREELADYLAERSTAPNCTGKCHKDYEVYGELRTFCYDCWLDWLNQEVQDK